MYLDRLTDMFLSLYEWEGLPDTINERYLEMSLLEQGCCIFFKDDSLGYLALRGNHMGFNVYNEPTHFQVYAPIGYQKELTKDNCVPIWNTFRRQPYYYMLQQYAERLYEITVTQDINVKAQKTPIFIETDDKSLLTMTNIYQKYSGNMPVIYGAKRLGGQPVNVLKTDAPFVADKLQVLKNEIWNECMTFLGIGNAKQDKKERLVADEVSANDEQIQQARDVLLDSRKIACEQINKMFGLNVSVDYKLNKNSDNIEMEGDDDIES